MAIWSDAVGFLLSGHLNMWIACLKREGVAYVASLRCSCTLDIIQWIFIQVIVPFSSLTCNTCWQRLPKKSYVWLCATIVKPVDSAVVKHSNAPDIWSDKWKVWTVKRIARIKQLYVFPVNQVVQSRKSLGEYSGWNRIWTLTIKSLKSS